MKVIRVRRIVVTAVIGEPLSDSKEAGCRHQLFLGLLHCVQIPCVEFL